jgi:hypothetical protein
VSFNLGADDDAAPSSTKSEAVNGGLVARGDGTAALYPNIEVAVRITEGPAGVFIEGSSGPFVKLKLPAILGVWGGLVPEGVIVGGAAPLYSAHLGHLRFVSGFMCENVKASSISILTHVPNLTAVTATALEE